MARQLRLVIELADNGVGQILWYASGDETASLTNRDISSDFVPLGFDESAEASIPLELSLISSFTGDTFEVAVSEEVWPAEVRNCDAYIMMHPETWIGNDRTATAFMSANAANSSVLDEVASAFSLRAANASLNVIAVASYVPTLAFPFGDERAQEARKCLQFLYGIARRIANSQRTRIAAIEVVAGSRVVGLWPARLKQRSLREEYEDVYAATILSDTQVTENIVNNFLSIYDELRRTGEYKAEGPVFAVELEPGPFLPCAIWLP